MKRNLGFTLAELLGVLVLLSVIVAVTYPTLMEQIEKKTNEISEKKLDLIYNATSTYMDNNANNYPYRVSNVFCVFVKELVDENLVGIDVSDIESTKIVKVRMGKNNDYIYSLVDSCTTQGSKGSVEYKTTSCNISTATTGVNVTGTTDLYYVNNLLTYQNSDISLSYADTAGQTNFPTVKQKYLDLQKSLTGLAGAYTSSTPGTKKYDISLKLYYKKYTDTVANATVIGIYNSTSTLSSVKTSEEGKGYVCINN